MVYRWARRGDIATQGEAAADDLHTVMDDRWQRTLWDVRHTTATMKLQATRSLSSSAYGMKLKMVTENERGQPLKRSATNAEVEKRQRYEEQHGLMSGPGQPSGC